MHFCHPIAQTIKDHVPDHRMVTVDSIAAAGIIEIFTTDRINYIVNTIVQSAKRCCLLIFISLGRMIEDHVEDDLNAGFVQGFNHGFEFSDSAVNCFIRCISNFGSKKTQGMISPKIEQRRPGFRIDACIISFIKFSYRHQFKSGDAQFF